MNLAYVIATISENWHGTAKGFGSEQIWWLARLWFQTKINFVYLLPGLICHYTSSNWKHWTKAAIGAVVEKTASKKITPHLLKLSTMLVWHNMPRQKAGFSKEGFMSWHPLTQRFSNFRAYTPKSLYSAWKLHLLWDFRIETTLFDSLTSMLRSGLAGAA